MAWVPLESNPEVMTKFLHKLGVPEKWSIIDIFGLEPELLAIIPKPVLAVILLYPVSLKLENEKSEEVKDSDSIYHVEQCVSNACGTVALIHSVANNLDVLHLEDGFLKTFLNDSKNLSFTERGQLLMKAQGIIDTHKESAQEGQTEAPAEDTPVYHHFIAFIHKNNTLYELDGRKSFPVTHGATTAETFLEDSARVCKEYMARDPNEMRFTVVALAAKE